MRQSSLSNRCREIILGSILGDGSLKLYEPYRNARFSFRHSVTQKEYFFWKVSELKEISGKIGVWEQNGQDGWGKDKLRYQSAALETLTDLYKLTHDGRRFRIRRTWLNQLSPLSLCVWWLDDGSLLNGKQGVLCTDGFPYEELLIVVRYFRKVWDISPRIGKVSQKRANQFRLWFRNKTDLEKFLRLIIPHLKVPSMLKKVMILYKDPILQERWISEVCRSTQIDEKVVRQCVEDQKTKLARFRE